MGSSTSGRGCSNNSLTCATKKQLPICVVRFRCAACATRKVHGSRMPHGLDVAVIQFHLRMCPEHFQKFDVIFTRQVGYLCTSELLWTLRARLLQFNFIGDVVCSINVVLSHHRRFVVCTRRNIATGIV